MFRHRAHSETYDPSACTPVIRASICNGERTAGFRDNKSGAFHEIMLIRDEADLKAFKRLYSIEGDIATIY